MPTYTITDPNTGRSMRVTGDSPPTEAELETLFGGAEKPAARTWGDTLTDALPLAGGVAGGVIGAAGGIPGIMAGSAIGGGFGEAARQRLTQDAYDVGDIASTAAGEGLTAGAFGLVGKGATRLVRGMRKMNISPSDVGWGIAKAPFTHGPIGAVKHSIEETNAGRMAKEALGSGRLNPNRVEKLNDVLTELLDDARTAPLPTKIGGVGKPLSGKSPALSGPRVGDMIATQPNKKWGTTSLHTADRIDDALRAPQGQLRTSDSASPFMMEKLRASGRFPSAPAPAAESSMASDAFGRYRRGNPQQQELLRELLKAQEELAAREGAGHLTRAGRSMLTPDEEFRFSRALRVPR